MVREYAIYNPSLDEYLKVVSLLEGISEYNLKYVWRNPTSKLKTEMHVVKMDDSLDDFGVALFVELMAINSHMAVYQEAVSTLDDSIIVPIIDGEFDYANAFSYREFGEGIEIKLG